MIVEHVDLEVEHGDGLVGGLVWLASKAKHSRDGLNGHFVAKVSKAIDEQSDQECEPMGSLLAVRFRRQRVAPRAGLPLACRSLARWRG